MLNAEADLGSEDEDEGDTRPLKRLRARSPSPQLDMDEEALAGIVGGDGEDIESTDDGNNFGNGDTSMGEDLDIGGGGNVFGGGVNNGVLFHCLSYFLTIFNHFLYRLR
jgi:hypothetical protein